MKRLLYGLLLIVVLLSGSYWYYSASLSGTQSRSITIAQVADFFLYAPLYVAKDAGFFEQQGLTVEITSAGGDDKVWSAVVGGSAQFGVGDPTFIAISDQQGQPGRVVSSIVSGVPFWGIALSTNIPTISRPEQLRGYTVATFPAPSTAYTLQADMFRSGRLEPAIRQGAFGALLPILRARQADIALELEPNVSTAVREQNARVVYSLASQYGEFATTGLVTTPTFIRDNPSTVRDIVCALQKALDYIHARPDQTLQILVRRFPDIPSQVARDALTRVLEARIIPTVAPISPSAWEKALELRLRAGDLRAAAAIDRYVDNTFAEQAVRACRLQ